jgi:hypothetical protein
MTRIQAVEALAYRVAYRRGLDDRRAQWVRNLARWSFYTRGSAWRAYREADEYAQRLADGGGDWP